VLLTIEGEFEVIYRKRTTGARRTMRCKLGPHRGDKKSYDMERANILPVLSLDDGGARRSIDLTSVIRLKVKAA
jgi:hypothetical protein